MQLRVLGNELKEGGSAVYCVPCLHERQLDADAGEEDDVRVEDCYGELVSDVQQGDWKGVDGQVLQGLRG